MSKGKVKKAFAIVGNVLLYTFLVLAIMLVIMSLSARKSGDDAITLFGRQMRIVETASMEACEETDVSEFEIKSIPVRSMVFIETVPTDEEQAKEWYSNLKVGDVCTFKYRIAGSQKVITHRIKSITESDGGYKIEFQGDNKSGMTENVDAGIQTIYINLDGVSTNVFDYVIGKVTGQSRVLGYLTYIIKQPVGLALVIIVPCAIIIVMEVIKITGVFANEKKQKIKAERDKQQSEIDELKRQLAMLTQAKQAEDAVAGCQSEQTLMQATESGNEGESALPTATEPTE
ncbi:MAG: hypothetical protein IJX16_06260 [Clostridia bacterium]|nr:hypothetical protein [Clostridia bacterium]